MRHLAAFLSSTLIAFAASALLLAIGWRFDTLDLFAGVGLGLVLGYVGASVLLSPNRRGPRRPSPARYALAGAGMGFVNFLAASAAVLVQPWLQEEMAASLWMKAVMALTGGWFLARAAADPGKVLIIAVSSMLSGLVAGWTYGVVLKRRTARPA